MADDEMENDVNGTSVANGRNSASFASSTGSRDSARTGHVSGDTTVATETVTADQDNPTIAKFSFFKNLLICNAAFFLLFSSFVGLAIVQSSLFGRIGVIGLGVIFFMTVVSCVVLAPIGVSLLGCKLTMIICFIGFIVWEISNFYPHWGTTIPAAVICGAANGAIWAAQATYFTKKSIEYAQLTLDGVDVIIARSFGTFFCCLLLGTSFGCLITSVVLSTSLDLDPSEPTPTEAPGGPMMHCGAGFCLGDNRADKEAKGNLSSQSVGVLDGYQRASGSKQPEAKQTFGMKFDLEEVKIHLMVGIHAAATLIGLILLTAFLDALPGDKSQESLAKRALQSISGTLHQLYRRRQLLLTPLNVYAGLSKSFMLADITQAYIGCVLGIEMIGYASVTYGMMAFVASLTCGFLIGKTGRIPIYTFAYLSSLTMCLFLLLWVPDSTKEPLFFLIPALWAIPDSIFISQMNATYGYIFADNAQGAFATFRFWEGIGLVLGYVFNITICVSHKIYVMLGLGAVGMLGYFTMEYVQKKYEREHSEGIHNISLESRRSRAQSTPTPPRTTAAHSPSAHTTSNRLGNLFYVAVPRRKLPTNSANQPNSTHNSDWQEVDYFTTSIFETSI